MSGYSHNYFYFYFLQNKNNFHWCCCWDMTWGKPIIWFSLSLSLSLSTSKVSELQKNNHYLDSRLTSISFTGNWSWRGLKVIGYLSTKMGKTHLHFFFYFFGFPFNLKCLNFTLVHCVVSTKLLFSSSLLEKMNLDR